MTDRELIQQALEALNRSDYLGWQLNIPIIKALRERLAQPERPAVQGEPFGYFRYDLRLDAWVQNRAGLTGTPFYTTPQPAVPERKPLTPQSPCEMTQAERKMFRLGWLECEAAHGIKGDA